VVYSWTEEGDITVVARGVTPFAGNDPDYTGSQNFSGSCIPRGLSSKNISLASKTFFHFSGGHSWDFPESNYLVTFHHP